MGAQAKESIEEEHFNMAMMFYISLNKLIESKDNHYINDDVKNYYKALRAIKRKISFKLSKKEMSDLNEAFDEAKDILETPVDRRVSNQMTVIILSDALKKLEGIDERLTQLMDSYKMIFPNIDTRMGFDKLYKKYGL